MKLLASFCLSISALAAAFPELPGIAAAMQKQIDSGEISGAVTMVVTKDDILHSAATGFANRESSRAMRADTLFDIKSMTKPVTAVALLQLQEAGKLHVDDLVAKYIPGFAALKTPSGQPANLTISHLMTHTSGLGEGGRNVPAPDLATLVERALADKMQFEPGAKWKYCQSGINTAARIIEIVSDLRFDEYLVQHIFEPLQMHDTTHYPDPKLPQRLATLYRKNNDTGLGIPQPTPPHLASHDRAPLAHSGLFTTAADYARFCQMLLNEGELDGQRILNPATVRFLQTPRTTDPDAGFVPGSAWGVGVIVVTEPQGVTAPLSPGTFGHGGAYGTQAWIDPAKGVAYVMMIQRQNYGNDDTSDVRRDFQTAAFNALRDQDQAFVEIHNDELSVKFTTTGAELWSIKHRPTDTEYMWQGDPAYWVNRSPNMFPVNVRFKDDHFTYQGKSYVMPFLGIAVAAPFKMEAAQFSPHRANLVFKSSPKTLKHYPFPFRLDLLAEVTGTTLAQTYTVTNTGDQPLFFALGGHPGLRTPLDHGRERGDYEIRFSRPLSIDREIIDGGLKTGQRIPFLRHEDRLALDDSRVPDSGMFLENHWARQISLALKGRPPYVTVDLGDFPNTNLWTPRGMPYVCIEPMLAHHDLVDTPEAIEKKDYLVTLPPGESRSYRYTITLHPEEGAKALR